MLQPDEPYEAVKGVSWGTFDKWFKEVWQPGEHIACIAPTGGGKTTFVARILKHRKHVLALDPKGEDETLSKAGFLRVKSWPPPESVRKDIQEGRGAQLVIGGGVRTTEDWDKLHGVIGQALDAAFNEGGWTLFVDELQVAAHMMRHSLKIQRNLVAARNRGVSVITAYQAPSWVPTAASRQATWMVCWPTRDEDVIKSLASKAGRPKHELQAALHELPDFHVLVIGRNPRVPMVITSPPEL